MQECTKTALSQRVGATGWVLKSALAVLLCLEIDSLFPAYSTLTLPSLISAPNATVDNFETAFRTRLVER